MNNKLWGAMLTYVPKAKVLELPRKQFKVRVPEEERISGRLYDYDSGVTMGLASDEQKIKYGYNKVFIMQIGGCPHRLIIHP